jgi:hypothetical protein
MSKSSTKEEAMKALYAAAAVAAALLATVSVAAAGPTAAKQRVVITTKGVADVASSSRFVLAPDGDGVLKVDSGTESATWPPEKVVFRDGQRVAIYDVVETFTGKRGSLTIRHRIEWVAAGSGYDIGVGTWKVARGTGQYAGVRGSGRTGNVFLDRGKGPWSGQAEGYLSLR